MPTRRTAPVEPRWLTPAEMDAWLPLISVVTLLPQALDRQLRDDAGVNHVSYMILAWLSGAPDRRIPMSDLARGTGLSLSRLSHAVRSLEGRGWVRRRACQQDGRVQIAELTDEGQQFVELAAPGHVAAVRQLVFDHLTDDDVAALTDIATRITKRLTA